MTNSTNISEDRSPHGYTFHVHAGSGIQTLTLDPERKYTLAHDSLAVNGAADTNPIYVATSGNPIAAANPLFDCKQVRLIAARPMTIGPGLSTIRFASSFGGPMFSLVPNERILRT